MGRSRLNIALAACLVLCMLLSLMVGSVTLTPAEIWQGLQSAEEDKAALIFLELRVPRTLLAALVGAALGICGALLQGWLRNPLADPGLFGTTACAGLGGTLAIHTGLYAAIPLALPLCGMAGALIGAVTVVVLVGARASFLTVVLAGVAVQSFAGALTALTLNLAPDPHTALEIAFWLLGSVSDRGNTELLLVSPFIALGMLLAVRCGHAIDALSLGEDTAASLGIDLARTRWLVLCSSALAVGPAAAVTGSIGFVGLVVPHLLRHRVGVLPSRLLIPSSLAGALLLVSADIVVRLMATSSELKLGVVTSLVGAPFFLWLLIAQRRRLA